MRPIARAAAPVLAAARSPAEAHAAARVPAARVPAARAGLLALVCAACLVLAAGGAAAEPVGRTAPPPGYAPAFDDGRLNPLRGPRSAQGTAATDRLWSRGVPRRAVPSADQAARGAPPPGYAPAFEDGRLDAGRAGGSAAGAARMGRLWSDTVPRRALP